MHNMIYLIGRLTDGVEKTKEGEKTVAKITLAVQRSFKNEQGIYETDFIPVVLWNGIAENTAEYCRKGDLIGIKGRLESKDNQLYVIADKVSFLASKRSNEE